MSRMSTYTVHVHGSGALLPQFEQVLDFLDSPVIVGDERGATLIYDVRASDLDTAIEWAWLRAQGFVRIDDEVILTVAPSEGDEAPHPWWKRLLGR